MGQFLSLLRFFVVNTVYSKLRDNFQACYCSCRAADGINEVRAACRLHVRLVTESMLSSSVTVRLRNVRQSSFLSPLYHLFVGALASVMATTEDNVFVLSVVDDDDVTPHDVIMNVTFSVRRATGARGDAFHTARYLRERVYLQRALLTKLSTLEVPAYSCYSCYFSCFSYSCYSSYFSVF